MTAEPTSDALERASAYVDGALAPHERLEIEGSAEVMAWVASLAAVRAQLAVIQPVSAASREAAIAAALSHFDPALAPVAATQSSHDAMVRTLPRRSRWIAMVGSAAAAVVLVVVGITVARSGDSDTNLATPAELAADTVAPADAAAETAAGGAVSGDSPAPATLGAITGPATVLPAVDTPEQLQAYVGEAPKISTYSTESSVSADVATATSRMVVPPPPCVPDDAVVIGSVTVAGTTATVIQTTDGELQALDGACAVLLTAAP